MRGRSYIEVNWVLIEKSPNIAITHKKKKEEEICSSKCFSREIKMVKRCFWKKIKELLQYHIIKMSWYLT